MDDDLINISLRDLQAMGLFLHQRFRRNGSLNDDVDDFSDNSQQWASPSDLSSSSISSILQNRQKGQSGQWHTNISQKLIPNKVSPIQFAPTQASFNTRVYNGQFSPDGNLFYSSCQDQIKIFDTSDPFDWKLHSQHNGLNVQWTISDIDLSPCQNYLIYSTMDSLVNVLAIGADESNRFNFIGSQLSFRLDRSSRSFAIYSVKFSGLGNEILAGTSMNGVEVYDLVKQQNVYTMTDAHQNDINSVCWANRDESQVFFTGSDDSSIKIWDRRSMRSKKNCEGVLIGHREGVSHISSRGDGVHVISNGKDQCCKLWDIRICRTKKEYKDFRASHDYQTGFDYRWDQYPGHSKRLAADCSVMTFRGHAVLGTLIRCYFSPLFSTAQRYVYSGSADGRVHVFDTVSGKTVARLNQEDVRGRGMPTARDVSWHPFLPMIAATSFSGTINYYYYNPE